MITDNDNIETSISKECRMVIFSFFSGVGMLDLGFQDAGFEVISINEYEADFINAYRYARRNQIYPEPKYGYHNCDVKDFLELPLKYKTINYINKLRSEGQLVGFIGGPPCPDFSVGGKNKGRDGENGKLAKIFIDIIISYKPDFFLFENVKGLIKTARHKEYFCELKKTLKENGYLLSESLLNAIEFGVPQDRDRIILLGVNCQSILFQSVICVNNEFAFPWDLHKKYDIRSIKALEWPARNQYIQYSKRKFKYNVPIDLTVEYWFIQNNVYKHANRNDKFQVRDGMKKIETINEGDVSRKSFKRLHRWRYSPTAAYGNNEVHLHPYRSRRLSVAEAMAIQSLPGWFELPEELGLTAKFKMIGNGVPYLMAYAIALTIRDFFGI